jgi:hypothetical protein
MALSDFTALLAVLLSGSLTNSASLTLTEAPEGSAFPLFFSEATRVAAHSGMRLLELELPRELLSSLTQPAPDVVIRESGDSNIVRFVYAPLEA